MDNKNNKNIVIVSVIALLVVGAGILWFSSSSSKKQTETTKTSEVAQAQDIATLATNNKDLSTLVAALSTANLVETFKGDGPFTVFAPTNAAFDALPAGTLDTLLKPENIETLKTILTYHVVPGKVLAADLKDGQEITTLQGGKLVVKIEGGKVFLVDNKNNKVEVVQADVDAKNGVVHVIGGVLLPQ